MGTSIPVQLVSGEYSSVIRLLFFALLPLLPCPNLSSRTDYGPIEQTSRLATRIGICKLDRKSMSCNS